MRLLLLAAVFLAACDRPAPPPAAGGAASATAAVPYRLAEPDLALTLPAELREVSGLTLLPTGRVGAVQDEDGLIYEVDPGSGAVLTRERFHGAGDFEGVELTTDAIWTLKSNGDLFRVRQTDDGRVEADLFETPLASRNDAEGLGYDLAQNRLLIACKEDPGLDLRGVRAVYAFDLATLALSERPVFTLDRARVDGDDAFKPSALAVHPATGQVYVLSSVRKALAVVEPDGTLSAVVELPPALYPQPEGIAFAADGTLFISNEGPVGSGTLLRFAPPDA
ncbi:SdiA-regulated domain-containing protein [Rubrivirga litoralis]|uniref:SdiA-regulated domain-containing protein n=1 Tax=Rubrivirga litoralis TaxID=3075598 RepID=A0ABU3BPU5_9BACT|nr:SdiA-regulated domain-containing protein [Rubrivirga sp. F394]MDT0631280.1 SdiA-regulated domain-containing protein [Rubrivirga sp. F394]